MESNTFLTEENIGFLPPLVMFTTSKGKHDLFLAKPKIILCLIFSKRDISSKIGRNEAVNKCC